MKKIITSIVLLTISLQSCSYDNTDPLGNTNKYEITSSKQDFDAMFKNEKEIVMKNFSFALVKALNQSQKLREIIKNEAIEAINLDPEVLIYRIKDKSTEKGTVEDLLNTYLYNTSMKDIFNSFPTLTVLVPELPEDSFNAIKWQTQNEIPAVAVRLFNVNETPVIFNDLVTDVIPSNLIPGWPILVVKENERIISNQSSNYNDIDDKPFLEGKDLSFKFTSPYYSKWQIGGLINKNDKKLIEAYNHYKNYNGWHRDYVYYNITPNTPNGPFEYSNVETLMSITTGKPKELYEKISDQTGDPFIDKMGVREAPHWKDGGYEFNFRLTSNSIAGAGTSQNFRFPVKPQELFDFEYHQVTGALGIKYFLLHKIHAKVYSPKIPTLAWDIQSKSLEFLVTIFEEDLTEEITETISVSSEFATNFGIDASFGVSELVKIGIKFGLSTKSTRTNAISVKRTLQSDDLGDFVINFGDNIIVNEIPGSVIGPYNPIYNMRWYGSDNQYIKFQYYPQSVQ